MITPEGIYSSTLTTAETDAIRTGLEWGQAQLQSLGEIIGNHPDITSADGQRITQHLQGILDEQSKLLGDLAAAIARVRGYTPTPLVFIDPGMWLILDPIGAIDHRGDIVSAWPGEEATLGMWIQLGEVGDFGDFSGTDSGDEWEYSSCDSAPETGEQVQDCGGTVEPVEAEPEPEPDPGSGGETDPEPEPDDDDEAPEYFSCVPTLDWYRFGVPNLESLQDYPDILEHVDEMLTWVAGYTDNAEVIIRVDTHGTLQTGEAYSIPHRWSLMQIDGIWHGIQCGAMAVGADDVNLRHELATGGVDTTGGIDFVSFVEQAER